MRSLVLFLIAVLCVGRVKAQDPEFTQFYINTMYMNPAMVGSNPCPTLTSMYRNQWPTLGAQFVSTTVTYDDYMESLSGGIGVMFMSDKAGPSILSTNGISVAYSNHLSLTRNFSIRSALQISGYQEYLDGEKFRFNDQIDPLNGFVYPTQDWTYGGPVSYASLGAGTVIYSDKLYFGYAASHLNRPNKSLIFGQSELPIKHTVHFGAVLPIKKFGTEIFDWSPNIIYRKQLDAQQINMGVNVNTKTLTGGIWYRGISFANRFTDAIIASVGIKLEDFNFMYSYDFTISQINPYSGGASEVSLVYKLPCSRKKREKIRPVPCTWYFN